jgi:hypothetical protein
MKVWVVTTKEKNKVVGVFSDPAYAHKKIRNPENVNITSYTVNVEKTKG